MPAPKTVSASNWGPLAAAAICLLLGSGSLAISLQTVLGDSVTATSVMGSRLWVWTVSALGGSMQPLADGRIIADVELTSLLAPILGLSLACWIFGGVMIGLVTKRPFAQALGEWGIRGWLWWLVPGGWELLRVLAFETGIQSLQSLLTVTPSMWYSVMLAGWLATFANLFHTSTVDGAPSIEASESGRVSGLVWLAAGLYVLVFTTMNWQLYRGLLIPHGDSAMYEEHLWNLTHGKGFRSYLDQGLFLGEHIQVIHLLLLPLHWVWPSHLLLELCETLALASGAVPVFWMARRQTGSAKLGTLLAVAYLLYFPMHFLDVAIDEKTFRPTSFGVPLMLFALDQFERKQYRALFVLLLLVLAAKEDYAAIVAPFGVWVALSSKETTIRGLGVSLAFFAMLYLLIVVTLLIPAFRQGADVHYAHYFGVLGSSPGDIVRNLFHQPAVVLGKLFSTRSVLYLLMLLLPIGFLPLLSPLRLVTALPLFAVMCLLELTAEAAKQGQVLLIPFHHFHAPLVPLLFWAAAAGLGNLNAVRKRVLAEDRQTAPTRNGPGTSGVQHWAAYFVCASALVTGIFFSFHPLGLDFWNADSRAYWKSRYMPDRRAEMFDKVFQQIPTSSRVASTDHIHPRFTHHERSYDYSDYPRAVNDGKPGAPADSDYIVIDTQHRYSKIQKPEQIPEYRDHPERWDVLPDITNGYFIVLKRRRE